MKTAWKWISTLAAAVAEIAFREKLASVPKPADVLEFVKSKMYEPRYDGERAP